MMQVSGIKLDTMTDMLAWVWRGAIGRDSLSMHCYAGCHAGGGNVVQAGASLFTGDLQRNGLTSTDAVYELIYKGKGKMPGYGVNCAPKVTQHVYMILTLDRWY